MGVYVNSLYLHNGFKIIYHPSWGSLLEENIDLLSSIIEKIGNDYTPNPDNIFQFARTDLNNINVIILGQDPYPQHGAATGRSFEVSYLKSWDQKFPQSSIRNIVKVLYKSFRGELISFSQIRERISNGDFPLVPPSKLFDSWESQGILMLNTYLTCRVGQPNSHRIIWAPFTEIVINYISKNRPNVVWFLWGNQAQGCEKLIDRGIIYKTNHPMILNPKRETDLSNSTCFIDTHQEYKINWLG